MAAIAQSRTLFSPGCCSSSNGSRKKLNDLKNLSSWSFVRATTKRGGAAREVWRSTGLVCRAEGNGDGRKEDNKNENENEMENPFDLEKEMEKVLESEESKVIQAMLHLPVRWIWRFIYVMKDDSNVATGVNYGVASCLILCVISKRTSR